MSAVTIDTQLSRTADVPADRPSSRRPSFRTARWALWTGRTFGALAVLFLVMDTVLKLVMVPEAVETTAQLGFSPDIIRPLGILEAVLLTLYLVPGTALWGAILWTGYLGGAVAIHVQVGNPLYTHILFPIYIAVLLWSSLVVRDVRVARALGFRG